MNKTIAARRRYVGNYLSSYAKRIRKITLTPNHRKIKIVRSEDQSLLARISEIANALEAEADSLKACRG